ncbi:Phosphorylcholine metabolism protein LicD [Butyrivibrio sp. INlla18]|uniref:LicD family protein n=1 Tax=Butyrivibrio sp. INlla18 TaxID=1520806 RepID=UPI0008913C54|nr:LicD family protein [Butyrivibrio sp. INlla18]SDA41797.1 Phosphorylcholine metabolism protein LicD [Butyrivibrio sp. INlla18]
MAELCNLTFSPEYFYDEVRDGFYIPEMMKRFWAAQLVVLSEIAKICEKHEIKWYIDMGSLIGAVRHKGYIPWDDDLDISMLRDDWELFFEYARQELPENYKILTVQDEQEYTLALGRITNGVTINYDARHLDKFYGCPYVVGVDIFPMDKLYNDKEKELERQRRGKKIVEAVSIYNSKGIDAPEINAPLLQIEKEIGLKIHRDNGIIRELALLLDQILRECRDADAKEVASMYVWITENWANVPIEIYQENVLVPFENTYVYAPKKYDQLLRIYYGDYMTVKRGTAVHNYPIYEEQEESLRQHLGHNPFRYTLDKQSFDVKRKHPKQINELESSLKLLENTRAGLEAAASQGQSADAEALLQKNIEMTATIEKLIEEKKNGKKTVLFLPCRAKWWESMRPLYRKAVSDEDVEAYVIPIPFYDCDHNGNVGERHDERDLFMADEHFTSFDEFDLVGGHPDVIVIQVPYDGESYSMTVPDKLYSEELLKYTDELVYIPCFDVIDPVSDTDPVAISLKTFIEQPAVVNADKVVLKSEKIRDLYIRVLTELAGEETRSYWEEKIVLLENYKF